MEMGSPYFHLHSPGLALSRGGSLRCSSSPLSESVLISSSFLSKKIYIVLFRVARVFYEFFTSDRVLEPFKTVGTQRGPDMLSPFGPGSGRFLF